MRTAFFGTPTIALPTVRALAETTDLRAVVCQPDRRSGRGMRLSPPPVKSLALELGLEVHQPVKVRTGTLHEWLREREVDAAIVLAYGRILPMAVLEAPRLGCINLHASLLPKYRGAAPIQWSIARGESETGISLMQMDEGMDTGPVFCTRAIPIDPSDDSGTLTDKLAELGAVVVREDLPPVLAGDREAEPQDDAKASAAPPIQKDDAFLDFGRSAHDLALWVRAMSPRPSAKTRVRGQGLKIHRARVLSDPLQRPSAPPGTIVLADKSGLVVATGEGCLEILRAQLDGKRPLDAGDLVNGRAIREGDRLGAD